MLLPTNLILVSHGGLLDGGTTWLLTINDSSEHFVVSRNQSMFPGTKHPGRLFFNRQIVDVRSDVERNIVVLLNNATIDTELDIPVEHQNIFGSVDGASLVSARNDFVEYIESDTYYNVSTHGIPNENSSKRWWSIFR